MVLYMKSFRIYFQVFFPSTLGAPLQLGSPKEISGSYATVTISDASINRKCRNIVSISIYPIVSAAAISTFFRYIVTPPWLTFIAAYHCTFHTYLLNYLINIDIDIVTGRHYRIDILSKSKN